MRFKEGHPQIYKKRRKKDYNNSIMKIFCSLERKSHKEMLM